MPRVVHFEIHAEDPARAIEFYQGLFDWQFNRFSDFEYWTIRTGADNEPGINGGLIKRQGTINGTAVIAYVCTVDVADIDHYLALIPQRGGEIVVPKMPIPGVGWLIYAKDTEGNIFGLMQADNNAR
jgi:uncharacterized protein